MNVEARVTFSEELLERGVEFQNDSFAILRWMMIAAAVLQLLAHAEKLGAVSVATFVVLMLIAFFLLPRWREKKIRDRLALHPWNGKEVRFVFKPDYLEVHAPLGSKAIDLQCITRASRDDRGILVFGPQIGALFIPSIGFESADERNSAFDLLRASLKKKG